MRSEDTGLNVVKDYLKRYKISTLDQLKEELSTSSTMTVFRKLKSLEYISSYFHRGKYYTLNSIPEFDETGLWSFNSIWFSKYGNLIETTREFVEQSRAGFSAIELGQILNVEVRHPLLALFTKNRIYRKKSQTYLFIFHRAGLKGNNKSPCGKVVILWLSSINLMKLMFFVMN